MMGMYDISDWDGAAEIECREARGTDNYLAIENHLLRKRINQLEAQIEKQSAYILVLQQRLIILGESHFPRE
jgi:hypothetical protein